MYCFLKKNYLKLINMLIIVSILVLSIISYNKLESNLSLILMIMMSILFVYTFTTCLINTLKSNNINNICDGNYQKLFENFNECLIIYSRKNKRIKFISDNCYSATGFTKSKINNFKKIQTIDGKNVLTEIQKHIHNHKSPNSLRLWIFNSVKSEKCLYEVKYKRFKQFGKELYNIVFADVTSQYFEQIILSEKLDESEKARKEIEMYLSKVSHELRTPLNGVLGMNNIAKEALKVENYSELEKCLLSIDMSGKYLLSIINNVLDMSKIGSGKMIINNEIVSFNNLINEISSILIPQMKNKNIIYSIESNVDKLNIFTDRVKLSQIITNLLSNSIKYNKENGLIKLIINQKDISKDRVNLIVEIEDSGVGMSEEVQKDLFTPYNTGNINSDYNSTGLGLAITKSLVTLLNGNISCKSKLGVGTTFKLEFVFTKVEEEKIEVSIDNSFDFSKYRALIVEDNDINALICKNYLSKFNIKSIRAINGEDGLNIFKNSEEFYFDFILMDIQMPVLNGYETTELIRNLNRLDNDLIIIAMTADAFLDDINKAYLYKMNGHISKPLVIDNMMNTIKELLKEKCEN